MYIMIGCVGYYRLGSDFDKSKPVTSVLPQDIWTSLANVGLLAHCIIAYMVGSAIPALQRHLLLSPFQSILLQTNCQYIGMLVPPGSMLHTSRICKAHTAG